MRSLLRLVTVVISLAFLPAVLSAQAKWKTYSYSNDGFRADFPSEPKLQKSTRTAAFTYEMRTYAAQLSSGAFVVTICDYGQHTFGDNVDQLFAMARDGALRASGAHLVSEKKIEFGGHQGLEFEADSSEVRFSARFFLVDNLNYQLIVVSPAGKSHPDAPRFFGSFQFLARTNN